MSSRWIIGLASGSCTEGVDAALLELDGVGLDLRLRQIRTLHQPFAPELRVYIPTNIIPVDSQQRIP